MDSPYAHIDQTYNGKMFICFIALDLLQTMKFFMGNYLKKISNRTTFTALDALSKIVIYKNSLELQKQKYAFAKG